MKYLLALLLSMLLLCSCAPQNTTAPFPPPEGYSSWEEYDHISSNITSTISSVNELTVTTIVNTTIINQTTTEIRPVNTVTTTITTETTVLENPAPTYSPSPINLDLSFIYARLNSYNDDTKSGINTQDGIIVKIYYLDKNNHPLYFSNIQIQVSIKLIDLVLYPKGYPKEHRGSFYDKTITVMSSDEIKLSNDMFRSAFIGKLDTHSQLYELRTKIGGHQVESYITVTLANGTKYSFENIHSVNMDYFDYGF